MKIRFFNFEDQEVTTVSFSDNKLDLAIACWDEDTDTKIERHAIFTHVTDIKINLDGENGESEIFKILSPHSEIIHFEIEDDNMLLIILWHDKGNKTLTKVYKFKFGEMIVA